MTPIYREMRTSHFAFIFNKKVINIGWNKQKTHPTMMGHPYHDGTRGLHAEVDCIVKAGKDDFSDYNMLVLRVDRNNNLTCSKPCEGCRSILQQFNFKEVYYSDFDGLIKRL